MTDPRTRGAVDRRHVIAGGLGAAGLVGLAACGDGANGPGDSGGNGGATTTSAPMATSTPASTTAPSAAGATPIVALADVPVGGAVSAKSPDGAPIVVAQPTAGTAVAFSAICTHQGCTVAPSGNQFTCPCHGSVFAGADGARVSGPAQRPLNPVPVQVVDGQVVPA